MIESFIVTKCFISSLHAKKSDQQCPDYQHIEQDFVAKYPDENGSLSRFALNMPNKSHEILIDTSILPRVNRYFPQRGTQRDEFVVPKGQYFVMGDNRDNSLDGRFWGFVPEENLVGEAVAIWMSFDFDNTEQDLLPRWVPTGIRFSRIGGIE